MTARARVLTSVIAVTAVLVSGCSDDGSDSPTRSPSSESQRTEETASVPTDAVVETEETIDIGGRSLYVKCWGEPVPGEPTVLLVSGQGPALSYWEPMAPELATEGHHLCGYDRAGIGGSEVPPEDRRTTKDQVVDLVALLDGADLNEPLVVVAHSLGSLPAIGLAHQAPDRVDGVVFVDPWTPGASTAQVAALPPRKPHEPAALMEVREFLTGGFLTDPTQNGEHLLVAVSDEEVLAQLDRPGPLFGDTPVVVLQAPLPTRAPGIPRSYHLAAKAATIDGNLELAAESTDGRVIEVEDTGHNIHEDQPDVVMDAILDVLAG